MVERRGVERTGAWGTKVDGVIFPGGRHLGDALAPLVSALATLHWAVDVQCGAWNITAEPEFERIDRELDRLALDVPELHGSSTALYRAGILPRFLQYLNADEWAYYVGFAGSAEEAASACARHSGWDEFWRDPPAAAKLLVVCACTGCGNHPGGTWAVLSREAAWLQCLRDAFACRPFSSAAGLGGLDRL